MTAAPRAVVTGGAGFVGSHLCTRLLDAGFDVVVLDNFLRSPQNVRPSCSGTASPDPRRSGLSHVPAMVDAVLHFASRPALDYSR